MTYLKRVGIGLLFGGIAGLLCYLGSLLLGIPVDLLRALFIFVNRILIGFVIGISGLSRIKWYIHGILIGLIVGLPFFLFDIIMKVELLVIIGIPVINCLFGLMIEFFTTKIFKAPLKESK
ncbi:MAG: hypothetical protein EU541_04485 [Promethearchaeota archaeon]|nr:MAG: hypothetical protein EU541_04485 [Candidatus Lokiarchaeota archaeon]